MLTASLHEAKDEQGRGGGVHDLAGKDLVQGPARQTAMEGLIKILQARGNGRASIGIRARANWHQTIQALKFLFCSFDRDSDGESMHRDRNHRMKTLKISRVS